MRSKLLTLAVFLMAIVPGAKAQYWQLANQATDMVQTALSAGMNYRGFGHVSYLAGVGSHRADVFEVSTTQGAQVNKWFYMGLGVGVDVLFASVPDNVAPLPSIGGHGTTKTGVAIPLYSDFRFDFGNTQRSSIGGFFDLRLGAAFLAGNNYIQVGDGYLLNSQCFYLRPSIGMRVPLSQTNPNLAFSVALTYQLMTSSTWYVSNNSMTLNAIGVTAAFEW